MARARSSRAGGGGAPAGAGVRLVAVGIVLVLTAAAVGLVLVQRASSERGASTVPGPAEEAAPRDPFDGLGPDPQDPNTPPPAGSAGSG